MVEETRTFERYEIGNRRTAERRRAVTRALVKQPRSRPLAIELSDISSQGCGFASPCSLAPGARVLLDLPGLEIWPAIVIWWRDGQGGLSFCRPMHPAVARRFAG
jgi:hypothetical protein